MANENDVAEQISKEYEDDNKHIIKFQFTIDMPKYAARFGIQLPDDSADELTNDADEVVQDSTVSAITGIAEDSKCYKEDESHCRIHGFVAKARRAIKNATKGITTQNLLQRIEEFITKRVIDVRVDPSILPALEKAAIEFYERYAKITIPLSTGSQMCFIPGKKTVDRHKGDSLDSWAEYAIHAVTNDNVDKKDGEHYRVFSPEKVASVNPIIADIVSEDKAYYDDKRQSVVFCKQLTEGIAKVVARPMEDGNLWADFSEVTQIYSSKKVLPDQLVTLKEIAKTGEVAKGALSPSQGVSLDRSTVTLRETDGEQKTQGKSQSISKLGNIITQDSVWCQWVKGLSGNAVESETEDADVALGAGMITRHSSLYGQCQATLAQCKAKNPMTCRYHGALAIANDLESVLRQAGINGKVNCELMGISGNKLEVMASVAVSGIDDEATVQAAIKDFLSLPGVEGDESFFTYDPSSNDVSGSFDIDMLDAGAKAKWGQGQPVPQSSQSPQPQPQQQQPQPQQQNQQQAAPQAPKRTRTRKRTKPSTQEEQPKEEQNQKESASENNSYSQSSEQETYSSGDGKWDAAYDENAPELYPGEKPPKPPKWDSPFTDGELDELDKAMVRLAKTARQINRHIEEGKTEGWLAKTAPNLPDSLQKFKNQIDGQRLSDLASKDTTGQVQNMLDLLDAISASEANGWTKKVMEDKWDASAPTWWDSNKSGNVDIKFDRSKYEDPYKKEREAYNSYVPTAEGRKSTLNSLEQIDNSKDKDAPKDASKECKEAAKDMDDLEEGFETIKSEGLGEEVRKAFGRAYHAANQRFMDAAEKCKEWLVKQRVIGATVADTIANCKARGMSTRYLDHHQKKLEEHEKKAREYLKQNSSSFKKNPQKAEENWKKNLAMLMDGASVRIAMDRTTLEKFLAEPKKGTTSGRYEKPYRPDADYIELANQSFGVRPNNSRDIHKYAGLYPNTNRHDGYADGYGEWEVEIDPKKILYFLGGKHSHTRYIYPGGGNDNYNYNASMLSNASIATATEFVGDGREDLFSHDYTNDPNGAEKVFNALCNTRASYGSGKGSYPEVWIADENLSRDKIKNIYPGYGTSLTGLSKHAQDYLKKVGIMK